MPGKGRNTHALRRTRRIWAKRLIDEFVSIEQAEAKLKGSYVPKLNMVLPAKKVARYLQIENKIRAIVKYDLAGGVPLVK